MRRMLSASHLVRFRVWLFRYLVAATGNQGIHFFRKTNLPRTLGSRRLLEFLSSVIQLRTPGLNLVDCGANVGDVAEALVSILRPRNTVLIEPQPTLCAGLSDRFPKAQILCGVVGAQSDFVDLHLPESETGDQSQSANIFFPIAPTKKTILVQNFKLQFLPVDWSQGGVLKIDVEGAELAVLEELMNIENCGNWLVLIEDHSVLFSGPERKKYRNNLKSLISKCESAGHYVVKWI